MSGPCAHRPGAGQRSFAPSVTAVGNVEPSYSDSRGGTGVAPAQPHNTTHYWVEGNAADSLRFDA